MDYRYIYTKGNPVNCHIDSFLLIKLYAVWHAKSQNNKNIDQSIEAAKGVYGGGDIKRNLNKIHLKKNLEKLNN